MRSSTSGGPPLMGIGFTAILALVLRPWFCDARLIVVPLVLLSFQAFPLVSFPLPILVPVQMLLFLLLLLLLLLLFSSSSSCDMNRAIPAPR